MNKQKKNYINSRLQLHFMLNINIQTTKKHTQKIFNNNNNMIEYVTKKKVDSS